MQINAQDKPFGFQHTEKTTAPSSAIWEIWTNVPNWSNWVSGLKAAELKTKFSEGAKGKLTPDKGPKARFKIVDVTEGIGYTLKTKIPFGWLNAKRTLESKNGSTYFTHEVGFTGLLKKVFFKKFGKRYEKMLPQVMQEISKIAEEK